MIKSPFLLIGAPGSGKTTVAEILANEDKDVAHYSTGELLRNEVKSGSKLGKTIEKIINNGDIVPVETALQTIFKAIKSSTCSTILIDGYPRSIEQMNGLEKSLHVEKSIVLRGVIEVVVNDKIAKQRVLGRNRGVDDDIKVFNHRLEVYKEPLKEIEDFYIHKNLPFKVSAEQELKSVTNQIREIIKNN